MPPMHVCPSPGAPRRSAQPARTFLLDGDHRDLPTPELEPSGGIDPVRARLAGSSILVAEDEAMVAMDIMFALTDAGAIVQGPATSLHDALSLAQGTSGNDGAILDIDLGGENACRLAELLASRAVPFLFHTGGTPMAGLEARFPDAGLLRKPVPVDILLRCLVDRMHRTGTGSGRND